MSRTISRILGTDESQSVALFGVGDLGRALLSYRGFEERGFHIAVAFDVDSEKVGRVLRRPPLLPRRPPGEVLREFDVHMAILASRPEGLQTLVDRVCGAGVHAILNFVPKRVRVPGGLLRRGDRHRLQARDALVPRAQRGREPGRVARAG